jgi:hypothetical protein
MTKDDFRKVVDLLRLQEKKDTEFADFMEKYLDGRCVPMLSDHALSAVEASLSAIFGDRKTDERDMSWIEWFFYECDFGDSPMSAYLGKKEYVIASADDMYDFLVVWMNWKK